MLDKHLKEQFVKITTDSKSSSDPFLERARTRTTIVYQLLPFHVE
jgi:hypothetical protein